MRSVIREEQVSDVDFMSEGEFATASGSIYQQIITVSNTLNQTIQSHLEDNTVHPTSSGVSAIGAIQVSTTSQPPSHSEGLIFWDPDSKCLSYYNEQTDMSVQIAQEQLIRVVNKTGADIANGVVVHISGAQGNRPKISKSIASSELMSANTVGMTTHLIPNNSNGYITVGGLVREVNTASFNEGDMIYLSSTISGGITNIKPSTPNHVVTIGYVIRVGATDGIVHINVSNGYETNELHDVSSSAAQDGDVLLHNGSYYEPVNLLAYTGSTTSGTSDLRNFAIAMSIALG